MCEKRKATPEKAFGEKLSEFIKARSNAKPHLSELASTSTFTRSARKALLADRAKFWGTTISVHVT